MDERDERDGYGPMLLPDGHIEGEDPWPWETDELEYESILDVQPSLGDFAAVVTAGVLCYALVVTAGDVHTIAAHVLGAAWQWLHLALPLAAVVTVSAWC